MAKKSIIIIDNYVGVKTLDLLRGIAKNASVRIFSEELNGRITPEIKADYEKARPDVSLKIECPEMYHPIVEEMWMVSAESEF